MQFLVLIVFVKILYNSWSIFISFSTFNVQHQSLRKEGTEHHFGFRRARRSTRGHGWTDGWWWIQGILPPEPGMLPIGKHGNHLCGGKSFVMKFNINS